LEVGENLRREGDHPKGIFDWLLAAIHSRPILDEPLHQSAVDSRSEVGDVIFVVSDPNEFGIEFVG
jgi:hypothetical protein